jgi:hypothetical protein
MKSFSTVGMALLCALGGTVLVTGPLAAASQKVTPPKTAPATKSGDLNGTWTGPLAEVGQTKQHPITITISGKTGTSSYPDQHCAGKLTRVGSTGDYAYFTETITEGKFDPASKSGCLDGSMTFVRAGGSLVLAWVAAYDSKPIIAYGSLLLQQK